MDLPYTFADPTLLDRAMTHRTWANEHPGAEDNERLELLGDAVVQLVVTDLLLRARPRWSEGEVTKARSALVNRATLARLGDAIALGPRLRLGRTETHVDWRGRPAALADAFEALAGAVYLDGGFESAGALLKPLFEPLVVGFDKAPLDARSALQERLDARGSAAPQFRLLGEEGPAHEKVFHAVVEAEGVVYGPCSGRTKAAAYMAAAALALAGLDATPSGT